MPKPFAAFDVDGTIFKSSLLEKTIETCIEDGIFGSEPFNEALNKRKLWQQKNNEGVYQSYLHNLVGAFVNQIAGVELEKFSSSVQKMIDRHYIRRYSFPINLIESIRDTHHVIILSGSPELVLKLYLDDLSIQVIYGSKFEVIDGVFTGEAIPVGSKSELIKKLVEDGLVGSIGSIAVGDTTADAGMLEIADTAIMFNASRTLTNFGNKLGWVRVNEVKDQITVLEMVDDDKYTESSYDNLIAKIKAKD